MEYLRFYNCRTTETISDDGWKKIIEDFQKLHENEERMELQLEIEEANKQVEEANKRADESDEKMDQMNQLMKLGIKAMLTNGMSLEYVSKSLSKSEDEILDLMK